jgi:hypothetical protein
MHSSSHLNASDTPVGLDHWSGAEQSLFFAVDIDQVFFLRRMGAYQLMNLLN